MDPKDDIRARLPIEQLVAQYCQLQKKGRNYVCLCPFHNDKKPSLLVSPDKGIAYCFACQSGGDIFSFVQRIEGVDFPTALRILAEKAGVELPRDRERTTVKVEKDAKERMRDCLQKASEFFQTKLLGTPAALDYVRNRGVTDELIKTFGIGYSPDSFSETYDHLLKAGFSRSEIVGAGLGIQKEISEERIYDRFRHRIMFPIGDAQGNIIGFGGRAMGDADAKYVNSPDGPLYHKSSVLYGLFQARDAIRQSRSVLLVEGYFDVVAAHKAGVKNAVAVSGTALTEDHVRLLKRYADSVILCLDQDRAGRQAADRAFQLLAKAHSRVQSVAIPAKDPDELVQRDAALFANIVASGASEYVEGVIDQMKAMPDIHEPKGRMRITETLFPLLGAVPTSVELRSYLEKMTVAFGMRLSEIEADFRSWRIGTELGSRKSEPAAIADQTPFSRIQLCVGLALIYPRIRSLLAELIQPDEESWDRLRSTLAAADATVTVDAVLTQCEADGQLRESVGVLALYCEENFSLWSDAIAVREMKKLCAAANRELMIRRQTEIVAELKEARKAGRADEEVRLLTKYQQIIRLSKMAS